ncbi:bifunctional UDP-N-acetylglucosamine diphosphorylase/glucosamine-1-phosphate N-acetyltransferase GlmU [bacterium]|nr:bifunctional UDP-N-acetylglucosamine diphosphorylase/glucosamine-1-phosphate N-acetyltransferase GlmU [bacterium]
MALHVLILAAGQGKRMLSSLPKVLHPVLYRPMVHHVLDLAQSLKPQSLGIVVGHGEKQVREACASYEGLRYYVQTEQKGTGHAVQQAAGFLKQQQGRLLVLYGDVPLLTKTTLDALLQTTGPAAVLTAELSEPQGYGRILRDAQGRFTAIREDGDCTPEQKAVREVNSGVYVFDLAALLPHLEKLQAHNKQGELYLTDVVERLVAEGASVQGIRMQDPTEMFGVNDRAGLAQVECRLRDRTNAYFLKLGVTLQDPSAIWIDPRCRISSEVRIEAGSQIINSRIESGVVIESGCRIIDCEIGAGALIRQGSYLQQSAVGVETTVGPYAHLRPGTRLGKKVRIGNFVEIKKSTLGDGSKASHLAYVGDAEVGEDVNLGCGFITCNYDGGPEKHRTVIESGVFVGSDTQAVAPVKIGHGSYIAAGSTVTDDVPAESLVITRGRQITKPGYAGKYKR